MAIGHEARRREQAGRHAEAMAIYGDLLWLDALVRTEPDAGRPRGSTPRRSRIARPAWRARYATIEPWPESASAPGRNAWGARALHSFVGYTDGQGAPDIAEMVILCETDDLRARAQDSIASHDHDVGVSDRVGRAQTIWYLQLIALASAVVWGLAGAALRYLSASAGRQRGNLRISALIGLVVAIGSWAGIQCVAGLAPPPVHGLSSGPPPPGAATILLTPLVLCVPLGIGAFLWQIHCRRHHPEKADRMPHALSTLGGVLAALAALAYLIMTLVQAGIQQYVVSVLA